MDAGAQGKIFVAGATGFIGRALVPALLDDGWEVIAASRKRAGTIEPGIEWRVCDLLAPETLPTALEGARIAFYLVHSMGGSHVDFAERERRSAETFVHAAARAGLERIVYLGGPAPAETPSEHLTSRLRVGEILRAGPVPTIELRASMVIGNGGASWQIVRDLAMRLPIMVLPRWLESRTRPIALEDVIAALVAALVLPIEGSTVFDIPGPDVVSGREMFERIAALRGRRIPALAVPLLTPRLSALWLKLVTSADFELARELVLGLTHDLLPNDDRFWQRVGHTRLLSFDEAARRALSSEPRRRGLRGRAAAFEEGLVGRAATKTRHA